MVVNSPSPRITWAKAPLATPGEVVKVSRGGRAEQLAALPAGKPKKAKQDGAKVAKVAHTAPRPKPKPSRDQLDAAESALAEAGARHESELAELAAEEEALERRKRELKRRQEMEAGRLERAREAAEAEYREALAEWRRDTG